MQLIYNHVHFVNSDQNVLIFLLNLGKTTCAIELFTNDYAIESFIFPGSGGRKKFKKTDNIQTTARLAGIKKWNSIEPVAGYYFRSSLKLHRIHRSQIQLTVTDSIKDTVYFDWTYETMVNLKPGDCHPVIRILNWYWKIFE